VAIGAMRQLNRVVGRNNHWQRISFHLAFAYNRAPFFRNDLEKQYVTSFFDNFSAPAGGL